MRSGELHQHRRSPVAESPIGAAPATLAPAASSRAVLHKSQNFAPGRLRSPQLGHCTGNGEAHSIQNLALWRLSLPHFEHCILSTVVSNSTPNCRAAPGISAYEVPLCSRPQIHGSGPRHFHNGFTRRAVFLCSPRGISFQKLNLAPCRSEFPGYPEGLRTRRVLENRFWSVSVSTPEARQ